MISKSTEFNIKKFSTMDKLHKQLYVKRVRIVRIKKLAPMYNETSDRLEYRSNSRLRVLHRYIRGVEFN